MTDFTARHPERERDTRAWCTTIAQAEKSLSLARALYSVSGENAKPEKQKTITNAQPLINKANQKNSINRYLCTVAYNSFSSSSSSLYTYIYI